jgi:hypothetical protein
MMLWLNLVTFSASSYNPLFAYIIPRFKCATEKKEFISLYRSQIVSSWTIVVYGLMNNFSAILSWREHATFWWDDENEVCFVLDQATELDFQCCCNWNYIYSPQIKTRSTQTHYPDSVSTSLCPCSLMLHTQQKAAHTSL